MASLRSKAYKDKHLVKEKLIILFGFTTSCVLLLKNASQQQQQKNSIKAKSTFWTQWCSSFYIHSKYCWTKGLGKLKVNNYTPAPTMKSTKYWKKKTSKSAETTVPMFQRMWLEEVFLRGVSGISGTLQEIIPVQVNQWSNSLQQFLHL